MDFNSLTAFSTAFNVQYMIVRPGISITLYCAVPVSELTPFIAKALSLYLDFVPPGSLQTYYASNGTYKQLSAQILRKILKELREPRANTEFYEFHFGQGPEGAVGTHAVHFKGSNLRDLSRKPLENNVLVLEFPFDLLEAVSPQEFLEFVGKVCEIVPFESGNAGYAFQHPQTFSSKTPAAINALLPRYLGFEPSYLGSRTYMRGHCPSVNWINVLNSQLADKLGGLDEIRNALPGSVHVQSISGGIMIRATELPFVGDVNRGATDIGNVPDVARLLRKLRYSISGFGTPDFDAMKWLARFDEMESIPPK